MPRNVWRIVTAFLTVAVAFLATFGRPWLEATLGPAHFEALRYAVGGVTGALLAAWLWPSVVRGIHEIAADKATGDIRKRD